MKLSSLVTILLTSYFSAFSFSGETPIANAVENNHKIETKTNLQTQLPPFLRPMPGRFGNPLPGRTMYNIPSWTIETYDLQESDWGGYYGTERQYEKFSSILRFCKAKTNSTKQLRMINTRGYGRCVFYVRNDIV